MLHSILYWQDEESSSSNLKRVCPGHERAIPIEKTVQELDIKEEGIFVSSEITNMQTINDTNCDI